MGRDPGPATRPVPTPPTSQIESVAQRAERADREQGHDRDRDASAKRAQRRRRRGRRLPDRAVVFVGPMAAGKTSLGKRVARELGIDFVDTDAVFVRRHGPIADFFTAHGEDEFRRIEAEVIARELARQGPRIVALGGGAVVTESTRRLLADHPVVLLLTTQQAVLRTANLSKRPLLRDDPSAWGRILEERRPLYEEVADVIFRTDRATKDQLTERASQWVRAQGRRTRRNRQQRERAEDD